MCLIITGRAGKVRETLLHTPTLLADIISGNKDGVGAMFTTDDGTLVVDKLLPANMAEVEEFIKRLPEGDQDVALHFRMRTHGDIDLANCHPYPVLDGQVHMMHNGVISGVDDKSDKTKSDTWHYIDQVVRPQLEVAPALMNVPAWQKMIAEDIGNNNRFVLLDKDGNLVVLNKHTGMEHDGMWFSNTYAWSPEILVPGYYNGRRWVGWDDDGSYTSPDWWKRQSASLYSLPARFMPDDLWEAVGDADADAVYKFLDEYPISTLTTLFKYDEFVCSVELKDLSAQDAKIVGMLQDAAEPKLAQYCRKSAGRCRKVAEVVAWYGSWMAKPGLVPDEAPGDADEVEVIEDEEAASAIPGQVVPRQEPLDEGNPDSADMESWRSGLQRWLAKQGILPTQPAAQPAKWTAQTPALFKPAEVAPIKSRTVMYRGYRIEVPVEMLKNDQWGALKNHLEQEAQRMHDEHLAAKAEADTVEAANETYSA